MRRRLSTYTAVVIALALLCGCGEAPESSETVPASSEASAEETSTPAPITVTDMKGREITLEAPATRVVALTAADCEILYALGAGDALVGRGEYCDYPPQAQSVPAVSSGAETNIEAILALEPQVVFMSTMTQTVEQVQQLEDAGVRVVVSEATDIEGTYAAIETAGKLMGKETEAAALIDSMRQGFDEVKARAEKSGVRGKRVYFEVSPLAYGLWAAGAGTFMDEVARMMGLENCFADVEGWSEISEEQVLERDPDYIVTITMYEGEGPIPEEEIAGRDGWSGIAAVKNGKILNLANDELSRPGPRLVDGAKALCDFVCEDG